MQVCRRRTLVVPRFDYADDGEHGEDQMDTRPDDGRLPKSSPFLGPFLTRLR